MKNILYIPGFWDTPEKFKALKEVFNNENELNLVTLDYLKFKNFGTKLNKETFAKLLAQYLEEVSPSKTIAYSMGAGFLYDFLKNHPQYQDIEIILINPLLEKVKNPISSSFWRVTDMTLQGQLFESLTTANKQLIPYIPLAFQQASYNKKIQFDKKISNNATFIWSEKDLICKVSNYESYSKFFSKTKLIVVPNYHHNWLIYNEPVRKFLVPNL